MKVKDQKLLKVNVYSKSIKIIHGKEQCLQSFSRQSRSNSIVSLNTIRDKTRSMNRIQNTKTKDNSYCLQNKQNQLKQDFISYNYSIYDKNILLQNNDIEQYKKTKKQKKQNKKFKAKCMPFSMLKKNLNISKKKQYKRKSSLINSMNEIQFKNYQKRFTEGRRMNDQIFQQAYSKLKSLRKNTFTGQLKQILQFFKVMIFDEPLQRYCLFTQKKQSESLNLNIKNKSWVKKLKKLFIVLLFIRKLKRISIDVKQFGTSQTQFNPMYRSITQIKNFTNQDLIIQKKVEAQNKKKAKFLFYPEHPLLLLWNFLNIFFVLYFLTFIPYFIAFSIELTFFNIFEQILDIYFILDILVSLNTTYKVNNKYEQDRKKVMINYIKGYFFIDLLTSIPFSWIQYNQQQSNSYNKFLRILKLPKLIGTLKMTKIFKLSRILNQLNIDQFWRFKLKVKENFFKTLYLIGITYFVLHIAACIFIGLGKMTEEFSYTWLIHQDLLFESNLVVYINSLYYCFVVLTTVGFGDIYSVNTAERIFSLVWMLFGIAFYSFTISFITQFFTSKENRKSLLQKKTKKILDFGRKHNLNKRLIDEMLECANYSSKRICYRWLQDDNNFLKCMNLNLKFQFYKEVHPKLFKCPIFNFQDISYVVQVIEKLKPVCFEQGQFIWKKNDQPNFIFIQTSGTLFFMEDNYFQNKREADIKKQNFKRKKMNTKKILVLRNLLYKKVSAKILPYEISEKFQLKDLLNFQQLSFMYFQEGTYIGEQEIMLNSKRKYFLKAGTNVQGYVLYQQDFNQIFDKSFPHILQKLYKTMLKRKKIFNENIKKLFKEIKQQFQEADLKLPDININNEDFSNNIKKRKSNILIKLDDLIITQFEKNPIQGIINDIKLVEYETYNDNDEPNIDIKTPGLQKMFKEWKFFNQQQNERAFVYQKRLIEENNKDCQNLSDQYIESINKKLNQSVKIFSENYENLNEIKNLLFNIEEQSDYQISILSEFSSKTSSESELKTNQIYSQLFCQFIQQYIYKIYIYLQRFQKIIYLIKKFQNIKRKFSITIIYSCSSSCMTFLFIQNSFFILLRYYYSFYILQKQKPKTTTIMPQNLLNYNCRKQE